MTREEEIEKAKTEYSPVWRISNEVFTRRASEILNIPIERIQVLRWILAGDDWGKLCVYVFNGRMVCRNDGNRGIN